MARTAFHVYLRNGLEVFQWFPSRAAALGFLSRASEKNAFVLKEAYVTDRVDAANLGLDPSKPVVFAAPWASVSKVVAEEL